MKSTAVKVLISVLTDRSEGTVVGYGLQATRIGGQNVSVPRRTTMLRAMEEAISEEGRQAAVDPHTETVGD
jgi:hypothetical protein